MLAARSASTRAVAPAPSSIKALPALSRPAGRRAVRAHAIDDTNFAINLLASGAAGAAVGAITLATSENRDKEMEKLMNLDTAALLPLGGAVAIDTLYHCVPGINLLLSLLMEPVGAACGVAYMMTLVLSAPSVDPKTLAPEGTVLNAQKANDSRAALRVPYTKLIPTALKVVDFENDGSSGAGWKIGADGLPRLPINSVLIVLGVGGVILEAASHAPVLSFIMPRILQLAAALAVAGYAIEYFGLSKPDDTKAA